MDAPAHYVPMDVTIYLDDDSPAIPAYVPDDADSYWIGGTRWNGWRVPIFPIDTFTTHADAWRVIFPEGDLGDGSLVAKYAANGTLSLTEHWEGETSNEAVARLTLDGTDYWNVGGCAYIWEEHTRG